MKTRSEDWIVAGTLLFALIILYYIVVQQPKQSWDECHKAGGILILSRNGDPICQVVVENVQP